MMTDVPPDLWREDECSSVDAFELMDSFFAKDTSTFMSVFLLYFESGKKMCADRERK